MTQILNLYYLFRNIKWFPFDKKYIVSKAIPKFCIVIILFASSLTFDSLEAEQIKMMISFLRPMKLKAPVIN